MFSLNILRVGSVRTQQLYNILCTVTTQQHQYSDINIKQLWVNDQLDAQLRYIKRLLL